MWAFFAANAPCPWRCRYGAEGLKAGAVRRHLNLTCKGKRPLRLVPSRPCRHHAPQPQPHSCFVMPPAATAAQHPTQPPSGGWRWPLAASVWRRHSSHSAAASLDPAGAVVTSTAQAPGGRAGGGAAAVGGCPKWGGG